MQKYILIFLASCSLLFACEPNEPEVEQKLPILGNRDISGTDTIYHQIPDFTFVNQDSQIVTNETFANRMYIADFFFTSCPTICPKVKKQMLRLYENYENQDSLLFVSFTVDPKRDTVGKLHQYAGNLDVSTERWHFLTGEKDELYGIADDHFSVAKEDPNVPGGFDHSGRLILVDENRYVRAFCDGTDAASVDRFMLDIEKMLAEMRGEI
ncbi:MAG: SCO family protein [Bacteroidota bacterium]